MISSSPTAAPTPRSPTASLTCRSAATNSSSAISIPSKNFSTPSANRSTAKSALARSQTPFIQVKHPLLIALPLYGLDQLTKWWVVTHLEFESERPVIPGFFDLVHYGNTGAAFGSF